MSVFDGGDDVLRVEHLEKSFGSTRVLRDVSFELPQGEFFTLLGSSGCGKTTTLRIIAGLETPDSGHVYLGSDDLTQLAPNKRPVNTVFQNYALFPTMDVWHNIAYGLKIRRVPRAQIEAKVENALRLVQLEGYGSRMPDELSGGQRQRVSIARAVVLEPRVLLFDEPLGALDLKLRRSMQNELKRIQQELGISFVYVTHDQEEALAMSDRIGVLNEGRFEQVGTPEKIYHHPVNRYVADFVGESNFLQATMAGVEADGSYYLSLAGAVLPAVAAEGVSLTKGDTCTVSVRPEHLSLRLASNRELSRDSSEGVAFGNLRGTVASLQFLGSLYRARVALPDGAFVNVVQVDEIPARLGDEVLIGWRRSDATVLREEA